MFFKYSLRSLLSPLFVAITLVSFAQNATIRGFVYDKKNLESIPSASVSLKGTKYALATDVNGYFQLSGIAAGNYLLQVTYLGYDTIRLNIKLNPGELITKKFYLV